MCIIPQGGIISSWWGKKSKGKGKGKGKKGIGKGKEGEGLIFFPWERERGRLDFLPWGKGSGIEKGGKA